MTQLTEAGSPVTPVTPVIVVLDDPAGPSKPGVWAEAFARAGWSGGVVAPTPSGWFGVPPLVGGNYDLCDGVFDLVQARVADEVPERAVSVIGIGGAGWSATLWALAGRAASLVLVDGSSGPWLSGVERNRVAVGYLRDQRDLLSSSAEATGAGTVTPAGERAAGVTDPRRQVPPPVHHNQALAFEAVDALMAQSIATCIAQSPVANVDVGTVAANTDLAARHGVDVTMVVGDGPESSAQLLEWISTQDLG